MGTKLATLAVSIALLSLVSACTKQVVSEIKKEQLPSQKTEADANIKKNEIEKRYLNEGFINQNVFRVIILAPEEECMNGLTEIEYRARKRAEASLQKFLLSNDRIVDQNTRASILNLISSHGKLSAKDIHCQGNNVFYFDIKKTNLKRHLKKITSSRN